MRSDRITTRLGAVSAALAAIFLLGACDRNTSPTPTTNPPAAPTVPGAEPSRVPPDMQPAPTPPSSPVTPPAGTTPTPAPGSSGTSPTQ